MWIGYWTIIEFVPSPVLLSFSPAPSPRFPLRTSPDRLVTGYPIEEVGGFPTVQSADSGFPSLPWHHLPSKFSPAPASTLLLSRARRRPEKKIDRHGTCSRFHTRIVSSCPCPIPPNPFDHLLFAMYFVPSVHPHPHPIIYPPIFHHMVPPQILFSGSFLLAYHRLRACGICL